MLEQPVDDLVGADPLGLGVEVRDQSVAQDRSIYEDFFIFSRALRQLGNMSERDYMAYKRVFDLIVKGLPSPDLLIYLWAPVETLLERIRSRGREIEGGITKEYLSLLETFYDEWLINFDSSPVLTIRSHDLNFVENPAHLDIVIERVNKALAGRDERRRGKRRPRIGCRCGTGPIESARTPCSRWGRSAGDDETSQWVNQSRLASDETNQSESLSSLFGSSLFGGPFFALVLSPLLLDLKGFSGRCDGCIAKSTINK